MTPLPPGQPNEQVFALPSQPKTSGLAIASLVCAIAGLCTCGLSAILGIVLGIIALVKIGGKKGVQKGRGVAIAGIVISAIMISLALPVTGLLIFFRNESKTWVVDIWKQAKNDSEDNRAEIPMLLEDDAVVPGAGGEAKKIPGIRSALDVKFNFEANPTLAEQAKKEAIEQYRTRNLPGHTSDLYSAVRKFQQALGYSGGYGYFENPAEDKIYQDALKELIDVVKRDYSQAVLADKRDDYRAAWDGYQNLLRLVPDRENPIYKNVAVRADRLKHLHEDLK